jgi:indolepyruvate ferredoxin oxidoreductase
MMGAFRVLARLKRLRGTPLDVFGYGAERRLDRELIGEYEARMAEILERLHAGTHAVAVEIAALPEHIRGFGPVKAEHLKQVRAREEELLARLRGGDVRPAAA